MIYFLKFAFNFSIIFKPEARAQFLDKDGKVDFNKVKARFEELKKKKVSLCNKYFNDKAFAWAQLLPDADQVCLAFEYYSDC